MNSNNNFWVNNIEVGYYDKILKKSFDKNRGLQGSWHQSTFHSVSRYFEGSENYLDYACGPGSLIGNYSKIKSIGYDVDEKQIVFASKNYSDNLKIFTSNKEDIIKNAPYDLISIVGLLEFLTIDESTELFDYIKTLAEDESKIILTTPNYNFVFNFILAISRLLKLNDYREVTISKYNKKKLVSLIEKNFKNFKIYEINNIGLFFSIFNSNIGLKLENFFRKVFNGKFGFLFLIEINIKK